MSNTIDFNSKKYSIEKNELDEFRSIGLEPDQLKNIVKMLGYYDLNNSYEKLLMNIVSMIKKCTSITLDEDMDGSELCNELEYYRASKFTPAEINELSDMFQYKKNSDFNQLKSTLFAMAKTVSTLGSDQKCITLGNLKMIMSECEGKENPIEEMRNILKVVCNE